MLVRKRLFVYFIQGVATALCGCANVRKNDGRTFAEKMNGENYESTVVEMGVPIQDSRPIQRKFVGFVYCGEGLNQTLANHALVSIKYANQTLTAASTDSSGAYFLVAPIDQK